MSARLEMPDPDGVVLPRLLARNAAEDPAAPFASFEDGTTWTRGEALDRARRSAGRLAEAGVAPGDRVLLMAGNGPGWLATWWGITTLRAVVVPVNAAYRGEMLRSLVARSGARLAVVDPALAERFAEVGSGDPVRLDPAEVLDPPAGAPAPPDAGLDVHDIHAVMWTSGTTGPSKGSFTSYLQLYMTGKWFGEDVGLGPDDVWLLDLPLFHQAAQAACVAALAARAQVAVRSAPAMGDYWGTAKQTGATIALGVSTMAAYLLAQPASPADRDHRLRVMAMAPLPPEPKAFVHRFGLEAMITAYGSTEVSAATVIPLGGELRPGTCGRARPGVEIRLVDEHDIPVTPGTMGEMVIRTDRPWELSSGYLGDPEATAAAWRNGWFHTGDLFVADDDGYYRFCDRTKDALRRRGENVSSFEVEREVQAHPSVAEAACVGVRDADGVDDEVKVCVVAAPGATVEFDELLRFCAERMPHFMVPRYFEVVDALPKTATMRVRKHLLREAGLTPTTWDREHEGWKITRQGLART